jgi:hypothetical protein
MIDVIPHGDARLELTDLYPPQAGRGGPVDPNHDVHPSAVMNPSEPRGLPIHVPFKPRVMR